MSWIEETDLPNVPEIFRALSLNSEALDVVAAMNEGLAFGSSTLDRVQEEAGVRHEIRKLGGCRCPEHGEPIGPCACGEPVRTRDGVATRDVSHYHRRLPGQVAGQKWRVESSPGVRATAFLERNDELDDFAAEIDALPTGWDERECAEPQRGRGDESPSINFVACAQMLSRAADAPAILPMTAPDMRPVPPG